LGLTHITIASVTIFLHRHQAHRALDLHPVVSHFFPFFLAVDDHRSSDQGIGEPSTRKRQPPNASQQKTLTALMFMASKQVLFKGAELYRKESKNKETLSRYRPRLPPTTGSSAIFTRVSLGKALP